MARSRPRRFAAHSRRRRSASSFPKASSRRCRSRSRISSPARPAMPRSASAWRRSSPTISSAAGCSRRSIQAAFIERITNIDTAPQFQSWKQINAQALVTGRMTRQGDGRLKAEFRLWDVNTAAAAHRPAIFHLAGILAADRAHHLRPDLRAADRREGLFRQPRRVRRRDRVQGAPRQAAGADGSGRRQCQIPDQGRRSGADAAVLAVDPGNHLYGIRPGRSARLSVQHRDRAARDRRQFPRHVVLAAVLAGRPAHHHEPAAGRQLEPVRDGPALEIDDAADRHAGDRHLAVLFARRQPASVSNPIAAASRRST